MKIRAGTVAGASWALVACLSAGLAAANVDVSDATVASLGTPTGTAQASAGAEISPPSPKEERSPAPETVESLRRGIQAALQLAKQTDATAQADKALGGVIDSPGFSTLDTSEQHLVLSAAAAVALRMDQPHRAHELITRATGLPEQSIDDWRVRLAAASRLNDALDEVNCVNTIIHRWRHALAQMPDQLILRAASDARKARLDDERLGMLELLYNIRWKLSDDREPSTLWRELSLLELERNQRDQAREIAAHIADPYDVIAMRADNRYRPLFGSDIVPHDVRKVANAEIEQHRAAVEANPRSLSRVVRLGTNLIRTLRDQEVLSLTDEVMQRVESGAVVGSASTQAPYDDLNNQYPWILELRAQALAHLGRFDDEVAMRKRSLEWQGNQDTVSHNLNLAETLEQLDRPREALAMLPPPDKATPFGRMVMQFVRLAAAIEQADEAEASRALAYLREHQDDNPRLLQKALVIAGRDDEFASLMLSRLNDPTLRSEALVELQDYPEPAAPPRLAQWRARVKLLRQRPDVRAAMNRVGRVDRYPVNYALF